MRPMDRLRDPCTRVTATAIFQTLCIADFCSWENPIERVKNAFVQEGIQKSQSMDGIGAWSVHGRETGRMVAEESPR